MNSIGTPLGQLDDSCDDAALTVTSCEPLQTAKLGENRLHLKVAECSVAVGIHVAEVRKRIIECASQNSV